MRLIAPLFLLLLSNSLFASISGFNSDYQNYGWYPTSHNGAAYGCTQQSPCTFEGLLTGYQEYVNASLPLSIVNTWTNSTASLAGVYPNGQVSYAATMHYIRNGTPGSVNVIVYSVVGFEFPPAFQCESGVSGTFKTPQSTDTLCSGGCSYSSGGGVQVGLLAPGTTDTFEYWGGFTSTGQQCTGSDTGTLVSGETVADQVDDIPEPPAELKTEYSTDEEITQTTPEGLVVQVVQFESWQQFYDAYFTQKKAASDAGPVVQVSQVSQNGVTKTTTTTTTTHADGSQTISTVTEYTQTTPTVVNTTIKLDGSAPLQTISQGTTTTGTTETTTLKDASGKVTSESSSSTGVGGDGISGPAVPSGDDYPELEGHPELPVETIDTDQWLSTWSSGLGTGSCPSPESTSFMGQEITFDYSNACWAASTLFNPILIMLSLVSAGFIIAGARA